MLGTATSTAKPISSRSILTAFVRKLIKIAPSSSFTPSAASDTAWERQGNENQNTPSPDDVAFLHCRRSSASCFIPGVLGTVGPGGPYQDQSSSASVGPPNHARKDRVTQPEHN